MRNDNSAALGPLLTELDRLSKDELLAFYRHTVKRLYALNREETHSKCAIGNSGEGFLYHRLYVIGRGRKYYSEFLEQPHYLDRQNMFATMLYCLEGFEEFCWENDIGTNNPEPTEQVSSCPPFHEACWHEGKLSDGNWAPHFVCQAVGDVLKELMLEYPDKQMTVLCGHTHSPGQAQILCNLKVLTGKSSYGKPELQQIVEVA